ncbi:hypothetical protein SISSUDRAFT_1066759 [Sistotremastrum suecicum HHB10207 ss-3]|uniref:Peptide N-acetyl-beta-D-glucosaminyl asparaginase amidase A N-terminal domain-containing protein n=1 Tax=Sistotremastrum suecicum HHB10207 ss-3 TaxID=1314776 RepID=A0A165XXH6_9AGAM|nr:hypothetical protein SISSUDRAFT_1066759 [Sistotremastrum suecicum HHB10207 ss-3]
MLRRFVGLVAGLCAALLVQGQGTPLVDFQVAQPPPVPQDVKKCTVELFEHTFGNSFGTPALATVTPTNECGPIGSWSAITLNLTATSNGTQFDRLAIVSFDGIEIWRSSTPEPSQGAGIIWTYIKDVTRFIPLFTKPGTLQLELDNLLSASLGLDGQYDVRFSITYYSSSLLHPPAPKSDLIVGLTNITSVPPAFSASVTLPRNAVEAYVEINASGNGDEEFWYFNAANAFFNDLPADTTFPDGPFREARVLVDGTVAGIAFPYAVYFTGAITPNSWRPITSYGALDLPTYFIDLTPFIPTLTDGKAHTISLDVISAESDQSINQNWFVSGLVQVNTDSSSRPTTGKITVLQAPALPTSKVTGSVGSNGDVNITVTASHSIHIEAQITSGSGKKTNVVWKQSLSYSNVQNYLEQTTVQKVVQTSSGSSVSTHNGVTSVSDVFQYPMTIDLVATPDFSNFTATFDHSYIRALLPAPFILGSTINNHQTATGELLTLPSGGRIGNGTNNNVFSYVDTKGNTFSRRVNAADNNITLDVESGSLSFPKFTFPFIPDSQTRTSWAARFPGGKAARVGRNGP